MTKRRHPKYAIGRNLKARYALFNKDDTVLRIRKEIKRMNCKIKTEYLLSIIIKLIYEKEHHEEES